MEVQVSEDSINRYIVPHLSLGKREGKFRLAKCSIMAAILYKLKTGCQWRQLPTGEFFAAYRLSLQGLYYHFRKWVSDGSQTICRNGGECVGFQSRKAANSCNSLFLADNQGLMLACGYLLAGQHHDMFQIKQVFRELSDLLQEAGIETDGLFLTADAGFDSQQFRQQCAEMGIEANIDLNPRNGKAQEAYIYFDEQLYKRRNVIEQANE